MFSITQASVNNKHGLRMPYLSSSRARFAALAVVACVGLAALFKFSQSINWQAEPVTGNVRDNMQGIAHAVPAVIAATTTHNTEHREQTSSGLSFGFTQFAFLTLAAVTVMVAVAVASRILLAREGHIQRRPLSKYGHLANDWGVNHDAVAQAEARVRTMLGASFLDNPFPTYLLAKGVTDMDAHYGLVRVIQKLQAASMTHDAIPMPYVFQGRAMPYLHWFLSSDHHIAQAMRERGHRLLNDGDTALPLTQDHGAAALHAFIDDHPLWAAPGAFVSLLHHEKLVSVVISRVQCSGVCFLHAAIVGLYYLINFNSASRHRSVVTSRAICCATWKTGRCRAISLLTMVGTPTRSSSAFSFRPTGRAM